MKVSDSDIRRMQTLIANDPKLTVVKACKNAGISTVAYYARIKKFNNMEIEALNVKDKLNAEIVLDAEGIVKYLTDNIAELDGLKGGGETVKDEAYIIEKQNKTLVDLLNILQRFMLADKDDSEVETVMTAKLTGWVFDTIQREMGRDKANEIIEILRKG